MAELKPTAKFEAQNKTEVNPVAEKAQIEAKPEVKKEEKKAEAKPVVKKVRRNFALVNGLNLHISTKVGAHICDAIRYKNIDKAITFMEEVAAGKKAVAMNNRQVGHRHDAGMMAGRYPMTAAKEFIKLLKNLKANTIYHEIELETAIVSQAMCNQATRPFKRGGARAKRSHVRLMLEKNKRIENKKADNKNKTGEKKK
jgi:ribosomal protein L22